MWKSQQFNAIRNTVLYLPLVFAWNVSSFATVRGKQFMSLFEVKLKHMHEENPPRRCMDFLLNQKRWIEVVIFIECRLPQDFPHQHFDYMVRALKK